MANLSKDQLIEKAVALGIQLNGTEDYNALKALVKGATPAPTAPSDPAGVTSNASTPSDSSDDDSDSISISYNDAAKGQTTRVFSREVHGKTFKASAKAFAEKFGGEIIK